MLPFERDLFLDMVIEYIKEKEEAIKQATKGTEIVHGLPPGDTWRTKT
jgi:hypothetical protein